MKRTATALGFITATLIATPLALASDLTVNVEGIGEAEGTIMLGLFDEATYDGDGPVNGANLRLMGLALR